MKLSVKTFRAEGMEAQWGKTRNGAPCIFARDPLAKAKHQRETWWMVDARMWDQAQEIGVREAFKNSTMLGDFFSISA